jgi:hypothetical protein
MECPSSRPTQTTDFQVPRFPGHVECQIRGDYCESHPPACFRALNSLLSGAEEISKFFFFKFFFNNEQMPGPKAPEHHTNEQEQWRYVVLSHHQQARHPQLGGHPRGQPQMCEYELGLQMIRSPAHRTMPAGPSDTERTRISLRAGVVDHVWARRSQCCLARISK